MKSSLIAFVFMMIYGGIDMTLRAQEGIVNITYKFEYINDLANKDNPYKEDMILSLDNQGSRYCSLLIYHENDPGKSTEQQALQANIPEANLTVVSGGPLLRVNNAGVLINEEIVKNFATQKMGIYALLGLKVYKAETTIPQIDWKIQDKKKEIGGYSCQKAVGNYGGRTYEVWFAPELPFPDGPWKLSGLPGLILEVHDQKEEISILFEGITKDTNPNETTASFMDSKYSIPISVKQYYKIKEQFEKNPETFTSAQAPNAKLGIINIEDESANTVHKIKKYNPMELK